MQADDIRWQPGSDPEREWAITRKAPEAHLLVAGVVTRFARSVRPPRALLGRRLTITAGVTDEALCRISEPARAIIAGRAGLEPEDWREAFNGLDRGVIIGSARLVGAFVVSRTVAGRVFAAVSDEARRDALGTGKGFKSEPQIEVGDWSRGRWAWCFADAVEYTGGARQACKGFGHIWDLERGHRIRAKQAEREAWLQSQEQQQERATR